MYDPDEILGVVPNDLRQPYDIREVIARLVDGSRFDEFKARFGETLADFTYRIYWWLYCTHYKLQRGANSI